ncbi:MAG: 30S ribosome-binding factor RbfA [Lentimicrobiaceae bacterium]|nr:30S ribosome-binding factor RbfA [Lentimicrobiaceae bacterium]
MDTNRQQKVNRLLQKELGEIFRLDMQPYFPGIMMTVTFVRMTPDLSVARVNLSLFPDRDKEGTLKKIKGKTSEIRGLLGQKVGKQLRIVPRLEFFIDDSLDRVERIEALLAQ